MIRKQIYLPAEEDARLKEIARAEGKSEAQAIRDAIRRRLDEEDERDRAWRRLEQTLDALPAQGTDTDRFDRGEAYRDRVDKYDNPH